MPSEVYLSVRWYTVDARHNTPRIGRILIATGRDATDVDLSTAFGPVVMKRFEVATEELTG
ncbi:transglutaminase-like putative cysteine protease [Agrobacterium tumefaciens]|nr:transglutaminase-like putative cysteine protease [Agrobacterium radiobacter]MBB4454026.1 transglutaminase-like putative cysteine protease [Agrobacterium radiobacter]